MDTLRSLSKTRSFLSLVLSLHLLCAVDAAFNVDSTVTFNNGFSHLFGEGNTIRSPDDKTVQLHLNQYTGSGFKSSDLYNHGFFSAKIKLPSDYTAGIVVAFYMTNGDVFHKTHDELDFEFLGNIRGKKMEISDKYVWKWEHNILWTTNIIIFYIDDVPIREIVRNDAMGADFPSKPMGLYATIWDASDWATSGGKYKVNYKYAPFVAEFTDLALHGCVADPLQEVVTTDCAARDDGQLASDDYASITPKQRNAMKKFIGKYMYYSYCYDTVRYPVPPPECVMDREIRQRFKDTGRLKFDEKHHRRFKKRGEVMNARNYGNQEDV
ncbi:putative xyloglucan endotransglucosylase/hydrolase protein 30 [Abeliophyllum distichum]|uniref:Xyloglucan endotransglucosylase/hydrolase n=1 Tax=Abeliophyllum distichum TaxID=126358 RepID=A0ABD1RTP7_9LAMI